MKKRLLFIFLLMLAVLVLVMSCSEDKPTEPKTQQVATPTFDPPGGTYYSARNVVISSETDGAVIKYTNDGTEPREESLVYVSPIAISGSTTLIAKAFKDGWSVSQIATAQYMIEDAPPPPEGMVLVERGSFNPTEDYRVTLSSFYIAKYEVTQSEWTAVMGGIYDPNWSDTYGQGPNHPAYWITWFNAIEYCNRLSSREGLTPAYNYSNYGTNPDDWPSGWNADWLNHNNVSCNWNANGYRLPTEMEREFAARGGVPAQNAGTFNDRWAGTDVEAELGDYAWYDDNAGMGLPNGHNHPDFGTHPVGTKLPNELGLYDMSGNVYNWVWDIDGDYPIGDHINPTGQINGVYRVRRGGGWGSRISSCAVSHRRSSHADDRYSGWGFRIVRRFP